MDKNDKIIKQVYSHLNVISENYKNVFLVLSFDHLFSLTLSGSKFNFYEILLSNYLNFFKHLPKNVKIILIKDTPTLKKTEKKMRSFKKNKS